MRIKKSGAAFSAAKKAAAQRSHAAGRAALLHEGEKNIDFQLGLMGFLPFPDLIASNIAIAITGKYRDRSTPPWLRLSA